MFSTFGTGDVTTALDVSQITTQFEGLAETLVPAMLGLVGVGLGIWLIPMAVRKLKGIFSKAS